VRLIEDAEAKTAGNSALTLLLALSYGARQEIVEATKAMAREVAAGRLSPDDIDEEAIGARLFTAGIPDPDLIIRTSGEQRISNFLLWQSAYAELVFIDTLWPDFGRPELEAAIDDFHGRDRRYGTAR
ncbi:MAG: di-trans,poly-cis-decaprenylcistransferase, partial [Magnetospirillum sp.]|nr:di-trans,poly-cis-decaprenylcistransferase [Magnetospirillum sp.]